MFTAPHKPGISLGNELAKIITDAGTYAPRSKQIAIGPSEMGVECTRKLAYKLLDWEKVNEGSSGNWAAQVGTAIHSHLANIFEKINGYEVETRVNIRGNLSGTIDLFDVERGIVIDWKTTGATGLQTRKREGASNQHIVQCQLYAYGKKQTGANVKQIALVYLPTTGNLSDLYVDVRDYDESIALEALNRVDNIYSLLTSIDVENNPAMWKLIPAVTDRLCNYCPYFQPFSNDLSKACNGDTVAS